MSQPSLSSKNLYLLSALGLLLAFSSPAFSQTPAPRPKFSEARKAFVTKLTRLDNEHEETVVPPPALFSLIKYDSPAGKLDAYVGVDPKDGKKHPAIIWIFGGFSNGIDQNAWEKAPADNDQSASAFREAGMVMMYPSLRGGNKNPGHKEGFFGEVDDVLAALQYLKKLDYVDPARIYLGGHSTGATLALLAAEASPDFRAVVAFGATHTAIAYGKQNLPFDVTDKPEIHVRAPILWMNDITSPTFAIEGTKGNIESLRTMLRFNKNPLLTFHQVEGATHFSILRPAMALVAAKFAADTGPSVSIKLTEDELNKAFSASR